MRYRSEIADVTTWVRSATVAWVIWAMVTMPSAIGTEQQPKPAETSLRDRLNKNISVEVRKMPIEDVIRLITEQADVDVVMSPSVEGEATVKLTDVTLEEALRSILEVHGYDYVIGDNIIRILARDEMPTVPERETTQVIEISYADVAEVVTSLDKFKSESGSVSHIQGTSHILITDREKKVQAMTEFIDQVDRMTPQILVEARIYDVTCKDRFDLGVQWEAGTSTTYDTAGDPLSTTRTDPFATGGFNGTIAKAESTTAGVRLGWLNSDLDVDILLKAQQEQANAKLLANPRILVLDNETADIKIVSEIPYQELQESALGGAIGTTAFREVGVELQVTPHLAKRDEMIRLHLRPVFSVVTGEVQVAGIGVTYPQPVVDRREADTKLLVKNGQTVVLGGLRKKEVTKQINKIPLLGDLPIAGALFRFKGENTVNSELLVFITPWIIEQPAMSKAEAKSYEETELPSITPVYTEAELNED
jgi:type IV pilus assembly protein PilQ